MGIFGKSEAEMKKMASDLTAREINIDNREAEVRKRENQVFNDEQSIKSERSAFGKERDAFVIMSTKEREDIAQEKSRLETRRQEVIRLEAEAKKGFADTQKNVFQQVIQTQMSDLEERQKKLTVLESQIAEKLAQLHEKEGAVAKRELAVTEREQKANAGFADKVQSLAEDARLQHEANLEEAKRLKARQEALAQESLAIEKKKEELTQREKALLEAEQKRDAGFSDERVLLDKEIHEKRVQMDNEIHEKRLQVDKEIHEKSQTSTAEIQDAYLLAESQLMQLREDKMSALDNELATLRATRLEETAKAENLERERIRKEIAAEQESWKQTKQADEEDIKKQRLELERLKGSLNALESELTARQTKLDQEERLRERQEERSETKWEERNANLDDEIAERVQKQCEEIIESEKRIRQENESLRVSLTSQKNLLGNFDHLQRLLGGTAPEVVIADLTLKTDELARLQEELATRPSEDARARIEDLSRKNQELKAENEELKKQREINSNDVAEVRELRRQNIELGKTNESLARTAEIYECEANKYREELKRQFAAYHDASERDAREAEIEKPYLEFDKLPMTEYPDEINEIEWLNNIFSKCDDFGVRFNKRILWAFHTSLKTAEWSPITVLAGVSGTGKSELPRLYSHFGGLNFLALSVQPNWDSQESMLGFFNSIDNRFDAQPVLRFLAQSQQPKTEDYPGLKDAMCMILLDEMNLAHPELYFAEFLSKLEQRRGKGSSSLPTLPVKIGAGMAPYELPLGRNILWTGTMNQDETTHSLSDKVLDRSIVINFPRPRTLVRRTKHKMLKDVSEKALSKTTWSKWVKQKSEFQDEILPYKEFLEKMNDSLAVAGRAIGHRVWQSIEFYMANYPDVIAAREANRKEELAEAMHTAFEDQLVQKVMPKLRGIDTRGLTQTDCLDPIKLQIDEGVNGLGFNLAEDFDLACRLGYGQFIWQTANYLKED